jgi:protein gp37
MHEPDVRNMPDTPTGHVAYGPRRRAVQQSATVQLPGENDLFHAMVPDAFILEVFVAMAIAGRHTFQVLTKRPRRMRDLLANPTFGHRALGHWPLANVWLGTSIETDAYTWRADRLRQTPAAIRFLSLEPLLGPLPSLDLAGIDWVIVGGESGPDFRPLDLAWVRDIRDCCVRAGIPLFFKQVGGRTPKAGGRLLDGRTWDQLPPKASP